jgi:hypothetical protein
VAESQQGVELVTLSGAMRNVLTGTAAARLAPISEPTLNPTGTSVFHH